ncbi:MAG: nucleotidyl transferase AbiEii/AbiGii toxin family protein [Sporichthyaceae bacterium]
MARIALAELEDYGFCLAGGYAVHAHGLVERPSEDIDLFTSRAHVAEFAEAVRAAVGAFEANALRVSIELDTDEFARLWVSDAAERSKVELGVDWRAHPPMQLSIGPVLHIEDAVANKVCALFSRAQVRDFIDVAAIAASGQFAADDLLQLAVAHDPGFDRTYFAHALRQVDRFADSEFAAYGLTAERTASLRAWAHRWAEELSGA